MNTRLKTWIACFVFGICLGVMVHQVVLAATTAYPAPSQQAWYPDEYIVVDTAPTNSAVTWTNDVGWSRLSSLYVLMLDASAATTTVSIVRTEGTTNILVGPVTNSANVSWTASLPSEIILRTDDTVVINSADTTAVAYGYMSLDR